MEKKESDMKEENTAIGEELMDRVSTKQDVEQGKNIHIEAIDETGCYQDTTPSLACTTSDVLKGDENSSTSEMRRNQELRDLVGCSLPTHQFNIPQLEVPIILDWEAKTTSSETLHRVIEGLPILEQSNEGLPSFLDGTAGKECKKLLFEMEPKVVIKKINSVSFSDTPKKRANIMKVTSSPSPSRYRTRSAVRQELVNNPAKGTAETAIIESAKINTPADSTNQRKTRSSSLLSTKLVDDSSAPKITTSSIPSSAEFDSMNMVLNFDSTESERKREAAMLTPDAPPFDLDTPPNEIDDEDVLGKETTEEGCIKDTGGRSASASITPMVHEYDKRVVKRARFAKSPYIDPEADKEYTVRKSVDTLYDMVCEHGWKRNPGDPNNEQTVIDLPEIYINLGDLADSVAPRKQLINVVAKVGINIIKHENQYPKKVVMPLRMSKYLIDGWYDLKDVSRCFENSPTNRLDQKDVICFRTLQAFPGKSTRKANEQSSHYWLVN